MTLMELTEYWSGTARFKDTAEKIEANRVLLIRAFNQMFDAEGNFTTKFDPYRTDYTLEDVGTKHQRGTLAQIQVATFLFEEGDLREHLHLPLEHLITALKPSYGSDIITLHFGVQLSRITKRQYTAVYAWKD